MDRVMLYFGSFNPIHNGHVRLAEYIVENNLCDKLVMIVSPQNPFKQDMQLAPDMMRFEMAEMACQQSRYADRIQASAVEFLLDKPSYTINTLRYLREQCGTEMNFSILMGADNVARFDHWVAWEEILRDYPLYVYPRTGYAVDKMQDKIHYLADAPLFDYSSTEIRAAVERGENIVDKVPSNVEKYIRSHNLWSPADYIVRLSESIKSEPQNDALYFERGKWYFRRNEWGNSINDFNTALKLNPSHGEARQMLEMVQEILEFRYTDIYNP